MFDARRPIGSALRRGASALAALALATAAAAQAVGPPERARAFDDLARLCAQPLRITVRTPTVGELQQRDLVSGEITMRSFVVVEVGVGVAMVEAGLLPTLANLSAAVFGIVIPLTWGITKGWEQARRRTLEQAIAAVPVTRIAEAALRRRLSPECREPTADAAGPASQLELLVLGHGLRGERGTRACSFALALATLQRPDRAPQTLRLAIGEPSDDPLVPPPWCADVTHFLADDGAATTRALEEAAAALGALAARHLRADP